MEFEELNETEMEKPTVETKEPEKKRKSSQAKIDANERYNKKAYDRLHMSVRKDATVNGDAIRAHAESMGETLNSFLLRAVMEAMERDGATLAGGEVPEGKIDK